MRNIPKSLSNIDGFRLEVLGEVQYNAKEDVYMRPECDDKAIVRHIQNDIEEINKEYYRRMSDGTK